jgi:hypothetical protein
MEYRPFEPDLGNTSVGKWNRMFMAFYGQCCTHFLFAGKWVLYFFSPDKEVM